jgi:repressor LexA
MITPKQKTLLDFVRSFQASNGYAPSQQEIAEHFGFKSLGTVQNYLVRLERQGFLRKAWNSKRGMEVVDQATTTPRSATLGMSTRSLEDSDTASAKKSLILAEAAEGETSWAVPLPLSAARTTIPLPLLGKVAAGRPIEYTERGEDFDVPVSFFKTPDVAPENHFVLCVSGNSMIEDGILDGDYVVIKRQADAALGQTVVAMVGNEATIKRYYRRKSGTIELRPANEAYEPILVNSLTETDQFRIEGVLVGVIRKYG